MNTREDAKGNASRGLPTDSASAGWDRPSRPQAWLKELPAWLLSLCLHAVLLVVLALVVQVSHRGALLESARGGGIVLATDVDGTADYFGEGDVSASSADAAESSAAQQAALPSGEEVPFDLSGALPTPPGAAADGGLGDALPSASTFAGGARPPGGRVGGNEARTSIFGAEGTGNKFVYVFDRSASMDSDQGRPMAAAKRELIASLGDLDQIHQFQIIFYNEHPTVFNPAYPQPPRMLFGDSPTKRLAQNFVRGVISAGGTGHLAALKMALGMQPDVIFFLTDAGEPQLSASELEEIRRRNARVGATLNVIEFGASPHPGGINFLVRLAQQNAGRYVYVDVTQLPSDRGASP